MTHDANGHQVVMSTAVDESEVKIVFDDYGFSVLTISDVDLAIEGMPKSWSFRSLRLSDALEKAAEMIRKMDESY